VAAEVTQTASATYTPTPPQQGEPTATYTPSPSPPAVTIAQFDNDSLQNPAISQFLSPTGVRNYMHANDVSYPDGDQDDWVQFEFPNNDNPLQPAYVTLECALIGDQDSQLRATLYEDGNATTQITICGQGEKQFTVDNTKVQQLRVHFGITGDPVYAGYSLMVVGYR
jgi:hypothetical protein